MSADLLLKNFHTLSEALNGVQKLRELILDLAVRGLLVPQDKNEVPASEFLRKIKLERKSLIAKGIIRPRKPLPEVSTNEIPFQIPKSWQWVRLDELGDWGAGATPNRGMHEYFDGSIPWYKSGELPDGYVGESEEKVSEKAFKECSLRLNQPGDILIAMYGATIGKLGIVKEPSTTNQAVCACTCINGVFNRYLFTLLLAYRTQFRDQGAGGAQPNISREKIIATIAPLPPTNEQHRIVTKVDQLMALCDELERRQEKKHQISIQLNKSALNKLTTARSPEEFSEHWKRIKQNFDLLYDTPENVGSLKQAILQLALQGKLVPQDPKDEPASVLLEKIKTEKEQLIKEKKLKPSKPLPPISPDEVPFELPKGWVCTRLGTVYDVRDGTHESPKYHSKGIPFVTSKNIYSKTLDLSNVRFISKEDHQRFSERSKVERGDILFAMIGSIGNPVIVNTDVVFSAKNVAIFKYYSTDLSLPEYLNYFLSYASIIMKEKALGGVQSFVSLDYLRKYLFPVPPLSEQSRIVQRVNQLFKQCNLLEEQLHLTQSTAERLMESVVRNVVSQ